MAFIEIAESLYFVGAVCIGVVGVGGGRMCNIRKGIEGISLRVGCYKRQLLRNWRRVEIENQEQRETREMK